MKKYCKKCRILNLFRKTINDWDIRFDLFLKPKKYMWRVWDIWPLYYYSYDTNCMKKFDLMCLPFIGFTLYGYNKSNDNRPLESN